MGWQFFHHAAVQFTVQHQGTLQRLLLASPGLSADWSVNRNGRQKQFLSFKQSSYPGKVSVCLLSRVARLTAKWRVYQASFTGPSGLVTGVNEPLINVHLCLWCLRMSALVHCRWILKRQKFWTTCRWNWTLCWTIWAQCLQRGESVCVCECVGACACVVCVC